MYNAMSVERTQKPEQKREFSGKGWDNVVDKAGSKANGMRFINITIDRDIKGLTLKHGDRIQLWPNDKRDGKQDADWRMSVLFSEPEVPSI